MPVVIHLNGQPKQFEVALTVDELLRQLNISNPSMAVAVNSEIVPRSQHQTYFLKEQDKVELIQPVGGG